jgi:hypothetical protein
MNAWEAIFSQSPVNEGYYNEQRLPQVHWDWPRSTWLQSRLDFLLDQAPAAVKTSKKLTAPSHAGDVSLDLGRTKAGQHGRLSVQ